MAYVCHACGAPATVQWERAATPDEASAHWDALEATTRSHQLPHYVQNRDDTVRVPVFGCAQHGEETAQ